MGDYDSLEDKAETLGEALVGIFGAGAIGGIGIGIARSVSKSNKHKEELRAELNNINRQLDQLKSNPLTRFFNSTEIEKLETKKWKIQTELGEIKKIK